MSQATYDPMTPYDYLGKIPLGAGVEVSTHRDFSDPMYGTVIRVAQQAADILYVRSNATMGLFRFCWHEDDARMQEPGSFEKFIDRNTGDKDGVTRSGVFRLTKPTKLVLGIADRLDGMDRLLESLVKRIGVIESQQKLIISGRVEPAGHRGPGRPKKAMQQVTSSEAAAQQFSTIEG